MKGKGVLKITKKATPTRKEIQADAQLKILKDVMARFEAKHEEIYAILRLKYVPVERAEGLKRIEFDSLIKRPKFRAEKFLIDEFERANIDDGKKVTIVEYLKNLSPVLKTDSPKRSYLSPVLKNLSPVLKIDKYGFS